MAKTFRPSTSESRLLSKIESSKERERSLAIHRIRECVDPLSNAISTKLIEENLIETVNKNGLQDQIMKCLEKLTVADDFDVDYQTAPFRNVVPNPHIASLFVTAFVIEKLINNKDIIDIFGSDEEIYRCINTQVQKFINPE